MRIAPFLGILFFVAHARAGEIVEQHGVRVSTSVRSSVYTWEIANIDAAPIMSVEMPQRHTYNPVAPFGWTTDIDDASYRAFTDDDRYAIRPGQKRVFAATVASVGAVLGEVPMRIGFGGSAERAELAGIWGPVVMPRWNVWLIVATLVAIGALHTLLLARREGRG